MKYAVSEVFRDHRGQATACVTKEAPHGFLIANDSSLPPGAFCDRTPLLFRYSPEGQHCYYVDTDNIQEIKMLIKM